MRYFDHDTGACSDDKIVVLRLECGGAAVDAYWSILETIYRTESALVLDGNQPSTKALCFRLGVGFEKLLEWCESMERIGLLAFGKDDETRAATAFSQRAMDNIDEYRRKCETARQNGKKGGRKPTVKPTGNQGGTKAVSERLAKEKEKEKEIIENPLTPFSEPSGECEDDASFAAQCLKAWNEETGQDVRVFPGTVFSDLRDIRLSGRTVEDVRRVVRTKRDQWADDPKMRRFLRPSTVFKAGKFEEYANETGGKEAPYEPDFGDVETLAGPVAAV